MGLEATNTSSLALFSCFCPHGGATCANGSKECEVIVKLNVTVSGILLV
jgi:hypothetical protein